MTVAQLLREMSYKEFRDWQIFDELEPFTQTRTDMLFASIVAAMYNLQRDRDKHPDAFPVSDFLMLFGDKIERDRIKKQLGIKNEPKPVKQKTWQELKAIGQFLAAMYNALEDSGPEKRKKKG
jgi:hypothetical protein